MILLTDDANVHEGEEVCGGNDSASSIIQDKDTRNVQLDSDGCKTLSPDVRALTKDP